MLTRIADAIGGRLGWSRQTTIFAISASLTVHLMLLLTAALIVRPAQPAAASEGDGEVPMAVLSESVLQETMEVSLAAESPTPTDLDLNDLFESPQIEMPSASLDLSVLDLSELGDIGGAGDIDSDSGSAVFESGAGGAASFFGVESSGNRFAYIVDVSGSMIQEDRIVYLKRELTRSIMGLHTDTRFAIILYSSSEIVLGKTGWQNADIATKRAIRGQINNIQPAGATVPLPAFKVAFNLNPRPDAIYFMTDGDFGDPNVASQIAQLNRSSGRLVPIHCITFIEREAEEVMKLIARQSGGSYTHVSTGVAP